MTNPTPNYAEIIQHTASQHYNVRDEYKHNTVEQNVEIQRQESRKFSVGAINITGDLNLGMMLRSACLLGAQNFYIFGRKRFDKRSTVGAENYINIIQYTYEDPTNINNELILDLDLLDLNYRITLCEQGGHVLGSGPNWNPVWQLDMMGRGTVHPIFLFGSESHGIPEEVLNWFPLDRRVAIPQRGVLRSFNVSAAMNIICWDYCKEMML